MLSYSRQDINQDDINSVICVSTRQKLYILGVRKRYKEVSLLKFL